MDLTSHQLAEIERLDSGAYDPNDLENVPDAERLIGSHTRIVRVDPTIPREDTRRV